MTCGEASSSQKTPAPAAAKLTTASKATDSKTTAAKVKILATDASVKSGEEFCIDVKVSNFLEIVSMQYSTNWDSKQLEYKGVKNFTVKDLNAKSFGRPASEPNSFRFLWMAMDLNPVSLYDNSTIYQVCFKAIGKSGTTTKVEFTNKPIVVEVANIKMQKLGTELVPATITIQ